MERPWRLHLLELRVIEEELCHSGQRIVIRPVPGLLVLFPSWLYHFVHPSTADTPRISIAFNAQWRPA